VFDFVLTDEEMTKLTKWIAAKLLTQIILIFDYYLLKAASPRLD